MKDVVLALGLSLPFAAPLAAQSTWRGEGGPSTSIEAVAYDRAHNELVVIAPDDTWVYDGNRWQRRTSPATLRSRTEVMLAYDEVRRCVVQFGGRVTNLARGDTWEWDGASWIPRNYDPLLATAVGPIVFDAGRGRCVRHGMDQTSVWFLWDWNGATWTRLGQSLSTLTSMVYDRGAGRLVGIDTQSLYRWNGTAWVAIASGVVPSPGTGTNQLAYDELRHVLVLMRGTGTGVDVFEWNGATFVSRPGANGPSARTRFLPVYDSSRQTIAVHGGYDGATGIYPVDTWDWNGTSWVDRDTQPAVRTALQLEYTNLVHDVGRGRLVLFQPGGPGVATSTFEWDMFRWHRLAPPVQPPYGQSGPLAYDSLRQRVLFVASGAGARMATWTFDGTTWTQLPTPNGPSDRYGQQVAYDAARDRLLMYGDPFRAETWLFDGVDWQQATPATSPPPLTNHHIAYDTVRQECVLFTPSAQTWTWNGSNWTFRASGPVLPRIAYGMTWDPFRQRVALTGGADPNYQPTGYTARTGELWEWNGSAWAIRLTTGFYGGMGISFVEGPTSLVLFGGGVPGVSGVSGDQLLRLVDAPYAAATAYGAGCPGSSGVPLLGADFVPYLGHSQFALQVTSVPALAPTVAAFGLAAGSTPLGNGCTQLVDGALNVQFAFADAGGVGRFPLPIPADPAFVGVHVRAQGAAFDPNGAFGGISVTAGLDLAIGN